jgi:hypothetical protein
LTEKSVRTRLLNISYRKNPPSRRPKRHQAFFSEHFNYMAKRNGAGVLKVGQLDLNSVEPPELAIMELFQFMIGHTDWSAVYLHNIFLIHQTDAQANGGVTAVPFDFDFSGLVSAQYATPDATMPIRNIRQRLYRGLCSPAIDWEQLFTRFQDIRSEVFKLVYTLPGLTQSSRSRTRSFLQGFYDILDSPGKREQRIIQACRTP